MRIESSSVAMAAQHFSSTSSMVRESLAITRNPAPAAARPAVNVTISGAEPAAAGGAEEFLEVPLDCRIKALLLAKLIEALTGRKVTIRLPGGGSREQRPGRAPVTVEVRGAPAPARPSITYERTESHVEQELMSFQAAGRVVTADGREIAFSAQLSMSRLFIEENRVTISSGPQPTDPLVLNLSGAPVSFNGEEFEFDLDSDGTMENLRFLSEGSAFLALDGDGDGRVTDGGELFGPSSGNGFAELAALDEDGNGWIDEGDSVFADLRLWISVDSLATLTELGIGAICVDSVSSPFSLRGAGNQPLGSVRNTGVFLREDGGAGTVQQVDIIA